MVGNLFAVLALAVIDVTLSCGGHGYHPVPQSKCVPVRTVLPYECTGYPTNDSNKLCRHYSNDWYFDSKTGTCDSLMKKCPMAFNFHSSNEECMKTCSTPVLGTNQFQIDQPHILSDPKSTPNNIQNPICLEEMKSWRCLNDEQLGFAWGYKEVWYFDISTKSCQKCNYIGRNDFQNKFPTQSECNKTCLNVQDVSNVDNVGMGENCNSDEQCGTHALCDKSKRVCQCEHGYHWLDKISSECIDIDECQFPDTCANDEHCENKEGSYLCKK